MRVRCDLASVTAILAAVSLAGCAQSEKTPSSGNASQQVASHEITVEATDTACTLSTTQGSTGSHTFVITNAGTKVTGFYVYGEGQKVLAEVENISPGVQRKLDIRFDKPGTYQTACKPGMVGDGIRGDFVVKG